MTEDELDKAYEDLAEIIKREQEQTMIMWETTKHDAKNAKRNKLWADWAFSLGCICFGALVVSVVVGFDKHDWTYCLAIPLAIVMSFILNAIKVYGDTGRVFNEREPKPLSENAGVEKEVPFITPNGKDTL